MLKCEQTMGWKLQANRLGRAVLYSLSVMLGIRPSKPGSLRTTTSSSSNSRSSGGEIAAAGKSLLSARCRHTDSKHCTGRWVQ